MANFQTQSAMSQLLQEHFFSFPRRHLPSWRQSYVLQAFYHSCIVRAERIHKYLHSCPLKGNIPTTSSLSHGFTSSEAFPHCSDLFTTVEHKYLAEYLQWHVTSRFSTKRDIWPPEYELWIYNRYVRGIMKSVISIKSIIWTWILQLKLGV